MNSENNQEKNNKKRIIILIIILLFIILLSFVVYKLFFNKKEEVIDESKYISYVSSVDKVYDGKEYGIALEVKKGNKVKYGLSEGEYNLNESPKRSKPGKTVVYYQITTHDNKVITGSKEIIINPKENKLKLSSTSAGIEVNSSLSIDVIENESNGKLSCESSNTSVVTCSVEDNKVILNTKDEVGSFIVTIKSDETEEYAPSNIDFNINILEGTLNYKASGYNDIYDGKNHGINVVSEGATIKYGLKEGTYDLDESPIIKDIGTTIVYYQISKKGYKTITGSEEVTISKIKNTLTLSQTSGSFTYPVNTSFKVTKNTSGGKLTCISSDTNIATCAIEKDTVKIVSGNKAGTVEFTIKSDAVNQYKESTVIYKATIANGTLSYTASGYNDIYDGKSHGITVTSEGATIKYGLKEGTYDLDKTPTRVDAGTTKVYYQITKPGYTTITGSEDIIIRKTEGNVTFNEEDKTIGENETIEIDISNPSGTLSCLSRNEEVATCSINNNKLVIKGIEFGKTVIELKVNESDNYKPITKEINIKTIIKCTFDGELVEGAEYINGQYTYRYKQYYDLGSGKTVTTEEDGWSVMISDPTSTEPVTTKLCTTINDKPIINMSYMFGESQATSIDLSSFDTSNVNNMSYMFFGNKATSLDLSSFNTRNVINMMAMFYGSQAMSLDLSSFDTSNVTNMAGMFVESQATNLDLSSFDTDNVTFMNAMFSGSQATSINLSSFDTGNVTDMSYMFMNSQTTNLDLSSFDTSNVTDMAGMFAGSQATILDLSSFDTSNVKYMDFMFGDNFKPSLATEGYARTQADADRFNSVEGKPSYLVFKVVNNCIFDVNLVQGAEYVNGQYTYRYMQEGTEDGWSDINKSGWGVKLTNKNSVEDVTSNLCHKINGKPILSMSHMFSGSKATNIDLSSFDTSSVINMNSMFQDTYISILDLTNFDITNVENMDNMFKGSKATKGTAITENDARRFNSTLGKPENLIFEKEYLHCTFDGELTPGAVYTNGQYVYRYKEYFNVETKQIETFDEDGWSVKLANPELNENIITRLCVTINDKPITNMHGMFDGYETSYYPEEMSSRNSHYNIKMLKNINDIKVNRLTSKNNIGYIDLSSFDTTKVTDMSYMFAINRENMVSHNVSNNTLLLKYQNKNSYRMNYLINNSTKKNIIKLGAEPVGNIPFDLKYLNTSNVTNMSAMFLGRDVSNLDFKNFDTSKVTNMEGMFEDSQATNLDLSSFDTSNVTNMNYMFSSSKATSLDLSNFDTCNVTNMSGMFSNSNATSLDLSSFNTSKVTNMNCMFRSNQATSLNLSSFDTSNVTDMSSMFAGTKATSLDLSNFDTSKVTNMSGMFMFSQASSLDLSSFDTSKVTDMNYMFSSSKATSLDLSNFDTSQVTNMSWMFSGSQATTLNLTGFDTSKVTDMSFMFNLSQATSLDLSSFDTSQVTNMSWMFQQSRATNLDLSSFDTSKVTNMSSMFSYSRATSIDLNSFDTSKVTNMNNMFNFSKSTSLDLSGFDTRQVTDMSYMFSNSKVTNLDLSSFDTSNVTDMYRMFSYCMATTGYARTQTDADRFNSSGNKPSALNFVVKP